MACAAGICLASGLIYITQPVYQHIKHYIECQKINKLSQNIIQKIYIHNT